MLAEVPAEVTKVLGDIESLVLREQFSLVILASNLIDHPVVAVRQAFLRVARRHLAVGAKLFVERRDPEWLAQARVGRQGTVGNVSLFVESAEHENSLARITLRYELGNQSWRQSFEAVVLGEPEVEAMLAEAGFASPVWLGNHRRWVESVAV